MSINLRSEITVERFIVSEVLCCVVVRQVSALDNLSLDECRERFMRLRMRMNANGDLVDLADRPCYYT